MAEPAAEAIGIVGAGTMGAGIAQVALEAGHPVGLVDADQSALEGARARIADGLRRRAAKIMAAASVDRWIEERIARLGSVDDLGQLAGASDVVIEAAVEDLVAKQDIFRVLARSARPDAILATNTSALSIGRIASATGHSDRILGLHFFNPAPLMQLVEVVAAPATDSDVMVRAIRLVERWGKTAIRCSDRPGFIVNRVNRPFTLEALRILRAGGGTVETIDAALTDAGYPMGPFMLIDLVGIDVNLAAAEALYDAFDRPARLRPSPIQEELIAAGTLGRKSGRGFYAYDGEGRSLGPTERFAGSSGREALSSDEIADRVILAVVNEAFRALGDGVASGPDIDLAMRLGANHPFGPIEWAERTGLTEVAASLDALSDEDDDAFRPAIALLRMASGQGCC